MCKRACAYRNQQFIFADFMQREKHWASPKRALTTLLNLYAPVSVSKYPLPFLSSNLCPFFHASHVFSLSYPDMPWSGTLRKSRLPRLSWLWAGALGVFCEPSLGRAPFGGRFCLCGVVDVICDWWARWAPENLGAPFWCAVRRNIRGRLDSRST